MKHIDEILLSLPSRHQAALRWFFERSGEEHRWPGTVDIGGQPTLLVMRRKGIYKPAWSQYALSVRRSLDSDYPDLEPAERPDGTWLYQYFQENEEAAARDDEYTNRALLKCWEDQVPIGVIIQLKKKPNARYRILGIALVSRWERGYFVLEGFSRDGEAKSPASFVGQRDQEQQIAIIAESGLEPALVAKAHDRVMRQITLRRGQRTFRANLLSAYGASCAISGCDAEPALEAAHIIPYREASNNDVSNGLLLRADLHTLFDLRLISVDAKTARVLVANELKETAYTEIAGTSLILPKRREHYPSAKGLEIHRKLAGL